MSKGNPNAIYLQGLQRSMSAEEYTTFCDEWVNEIDGRAFIDDMDTIRDLLLKGIRYCEDGDYYLSHKPMLRALRVLEDYLPRNEDLE